IVLYLLKSLKHVFTVARDSRFVVVSRLLSHSSPPSTIEDRLKCRPPNRPQSARPLEQSSDGGTLQTTARRKRYLWVIGRGCNTNLRIGGSYSTFRGGTARPPLQKL